MTGHYENFGIRFLYPENWSIAEEDASGWPRTVTLQNPSGAFWSLHVYSPPRKPLELTTTVLETMRGEYEDFESQEATDVMGDIEIHGFDMDFYCLDMVVEARVRGVTVGEATYLFFYQAESQEFTKLDQVFRAMALSTLQNVAAVP